MAEQQTPRLSFHGSTRFGEDYEVRADGTRIGAASRTREQRLRWKARLDATGFEVFSPLLREARDVAENAATHATNAGNVELARSYLTALKSIERELHTYPLAAVLSSEEGASNAD